jgi:hypothetical protein
MIQKAIIVTVFLSVTALFSAEVDTASRAWSPVIGWIETAPGDSGMKVFDSHLEGFSYNENIGLIRFGTYTEGGEHIYENSAAGNYGVNNDGSGILSGYAWSSTAGWIDFAPENGGVTINPETGVFSGYALNENVGWIGFAGEAGDGTEYSFVTDWRGENTAIVDEGADTTKSGLKPGIYVLNNPVDIRAGKVEFAVAVKGPSEIEVVILSHLGDVLDRQEFFTRTDGTTPHRFSWDLKNMNGTPVGLGSYLAVARVRCTNTGSTVEYRSLVGIRK